MKLLLRRSRTLSLLCGLVLLGGCSIVSMPVLDVAQGTFASWYGPAAGGNIPDVPNPAYRFLRVEIQGHPPVLLVLGYLDKSTYGEVEVWYSSRGEVLRIVAGRVVGTVGLEVDWRSVRYHQFPTHWPLTNESPGGYVRERDVMPGYRYSVLDRIELRRLNTAPEGARPVRIPAAVAWYQETVVGPIPVQLPASLYAVMTIQNQQTVVYSRQCLSDSLCLHIQPWPVPTAKP